MMKTHSAKTASHPAGRGRSSRGEGRLSSRVLALSFVLPVLSLWGWAGCNAQVAGGDNGDLSVPADLSASGGADGGADGSILACATATTQVDAVGLYLLFVLDGSGSMRQNGKWDATVPALTSVFGSLQKQQNSFIGAGLTVFGDRNDKTISDNFAGPYNSMDVPVGYIDTVQLGKLTDRLVNTAPYLGTPTYEVLSGQFPLLRAFQPQAPLSPGGKRVMVFITDGVPDTDMPAGTNEVPWSLSLTAMQASIANPIPTFVVGVGHFVPQMGESYSPAFLGDMAVAGGTRASATCDPHEMTDPGKVCYFQITPPAGAPTDQDIATLRDNLIAALVQIQKQAQSCEFTLQAVSSGQGELDPTQVNVVYVSGSGSKTLVPQNPDSGWSYDDPQHPTRVILHGASCSQVSADPKGKVTVVVGCKTVLG